MANVLTKLDLPNRKALQGWFRAPSGSALDGKERTAVEKPLLGKIGQISRSVSDLQKAVHWYDEVLGLPHLFTFGNLAFFDCDRTRLLLTQAPVAAADSILYFRVDDK